MKALNSFRFAVMVCALFIALTSCVGIKNEIQSDLGSGSYLFEALENSPQSGVVWEVQGDTILYIQYGKTIPRYSAQSQFKPEGVETLHCALAKVCFQLGSQEPECISNCAVSVASTKGDSIPMAAVFVPPYSGQSGFWVLMHEGTVRGLPVGTITRPAGWAAGGRLSQVDPKNQRP